MLINFSTQNSIQEELAKIPSLVLLTPSSISYAKLVAEIPSASDKPL